MIDVKRREPNAPAPCKPVKDVEQHHGVEPTAQAYEQPVTRLHRASQLAVNDGK